MARRGGLGLFLLGFVALLVLAETVGKMPYGVKETEPFCVGDNRVSFTVVDNSLQEVSTPCGTGELCYEGACLPRTCPTGVSLKTCADLYTVIESTCSNGVYIHKALSCPTGSTCNEGTCFKPNAVCGNDACELGETDLSCPRDCSSLSDWNTYNSEVEESTALQNNLLCSGEFDCDNPIIQTALNEIEANFDTSTPIKFIDAVTNWTYNLIRYDLNGGLAQCNEKASDLLARYYTYNTMIYGNCVDYTTISIALLRARGIPSYQSGVCVSTRVGWSCVPFAVIGMPSRAGNIRNDQSAGHSVTMAYAGREIGYTIHDATMGKTLAQSCIGYTQNLISGTTSQVCYIPDHLYRQYC